MLKIKKRHLNSPRLITTVLLVLVLAIGLYLLLPDSEGEGKKRDGAGQGTINLDPPSKTDKNRVEDNKQRIVDQENGQPPRESSSANGKREVSPVITYAGQYGSKVEVGGYINGVFENGGICTVTFTKNGAVITKTSQGVGDVRTTSCPTLTAEASELSPKGAWEAVLSYDSPTAFGKSVSRTIEVK